MRKGKRLIPYFGLFIPPTIALIFYGYLGSFTRFLADDFCSAYYANRLGLLRSIWYWRLNWSGRYTAFGADWIMEKIGAYALPIIPPLSLLAWWILTVGVIYLWISNVLSDEFLRPAAYSLGTVFLFVVFVISPDVPQSIYWWNGMRSYSLPLILLTGYAILFQIGVNRLGTQRQIFAGIVMSFLLTFAIGGLGETYVAFQLSLLAYLWVLELLIHKNLKSSASLFLFAGLTASILSLVLVASAPGNAIRQTFFPLHPDIFQLFQISLKGFMDFVLLIFQTPEQIAGVGGAILVSIWMGMHTRHKQSDKHWVPILSFIGAFVLFIACIVPGVYATSEIPPPRAWIIPVFIGIACLMYTGFLAGEMYEFGRYRSRAVKNLTFILAFLTTSYSALITTRELFVNRDVYIKFAQLWDGTDELILTAKADGLESVQIPGMDNWAGLERPTPKKEYWPNVCYSLYYGIQVYGPSYSEQLE